MGGGLCGLVAVGRGTIVALAVVATAVAIRALGVSLDSCPDGPEIMGRWGAKMCLVIGKALARSVGIANRDISNNVCTLGKGR